MRHCTLYIFMYIHENRKKLKIYVMRHFSGLFFLFFELSFSFYNGEFAAIQITLCRMLDTRGRIARWVVLSFCPRGSIFNKNLLSSHSKKSVNDLMFYDDFRIFWSPLPTPLLIIRSQAAPLRTVEF